ncbi:hypothetical protein PAJ34TS1_58260 [Paenibacillus azoreducens]|uniref:Uncharacterized protein n=1 Tax=Paenibacillus azoreducens TaxID=116718 RepID=A0A920CVH5_9BACL|nr:hypothetical protein J34TS1_62090 [Paenibacillus azoreducens]
MLKNPYLARAQINAKCSFYSQNKIPPLLKTDHLMPIISQFKTINNNSVHFNLNNEAIQFNCKRYQITNKGR